MAIQHLDSLAEELIKTGIMTNHEKVQPGVWKGDIDGSRVFNRDETPQAIRYGVDGTANNLAYCPKEERCTDIMTLEIFTISTDLWKKVTISSATRLKMTMF